MLDEEYLTYPVLPLRDIVVFPHMIVPLFVGREKSVKALEEVMKDNKQILLSSQVDSSEDQPTEDTIFKTGVLANVLQLLKLPDGTVKVLVEGQTRVLITEFLNNKSFFEAKCDEIEETLGDEKANSALVKTVSKEFDRYAKVKKNIPDEASSGIFFLTLAYRSNSLETVLTNAEFAFSSPRVSSISSHFASKKDLLFKNSVIRTRV